MTMRKRHCRSHVHVYPYQCTILLLLMLLLGLLAFDKTNHGALCLQIGKYEVFGRFKKAAATAAATTVFLPMDANETFVREYFMDLALEQAVEAQRQNEVPIGAIVVKEVAHEHEQTPRRQRQFEVLGHGHNGVEAQADASAHAELQAMRSAAKVQGNWRLLNVTLYSTLEPCPMCLAAAQAFRVQRVVYGAPDFRLGAIESYMPYMELAPPHPFHPHLEAHGGIRSDQSSELMKSFFRQRRKDSKNRNKAQITPPSSSTRPTIQRRRVSDFLSRLRRRN